MRKRCTICNKNKKIEMYRKNSRRCKKCEYQLRKEYLINYSKERYKKNKNKPKPKPKNIKVSYKPKNIDIDTVIKIYISI